MSRTVLVVDDDDAIRMVAEVALEAVGGLGVLSAASGPEGLELAAEEHPDVVLLDVMMPGMDGITTFCLLRENPVTADIPVILVTAKVQVDDRLPWEGLAIAGVIPKPFDPMTLARDVGTMLGWDD